MKKYFAASALACGLLFAGAAGATCDITWQQYGDVPINDIVGRSIPKDWCKQFPSNKYELFIAMDEYQSRDAGVLSHVIVGIIKKGSKNYPIVRYSGYARDGSGSTPADVTRKTREAVAESLKGLMENRHLITKDSIR